MRMKLTLALGLLVLAVLNVGVYRKELFLETAEEVYFELAPLDPRSLMQGDYVRLNYKLLGDLHRDFDRIRSAGKNEIPESGKVILRLDDRRVASFRGLWDGGPLAEDERILHYSGRGGIRGGRRVHVASESFFFEEGQGEAYEEARYGVFKLGKDGRTILRALVDENFVRIQPAAKK
jgi:uncharacterized membrane-anchored protein